MVDLSVKQKAAKEWLEGVLADREYAESVEAFSDVVDNYFSFKGYGSATKLAGAFGTAASTVTRWARAKTTPHAIVRRQVIEHIAARM
ncbi:hypothetical protein NHF45_13555 [Maricaulaceae bacterium NA33B04]|nr:hypothetical protein [Maricaulaceae bacterium NA33B04]